MEDLADSQALIRRLDRLEQHNRRLSWALLVLAALALATFTSATVAVAKGPTVIEASQFVLKDADGSTRGELSIADGEGRLLLYGENGKLTAELPMRLQGFPVKR